MKKIILCLLFITSAVICGAEVAVQKIGVYQCGKQPKQVIFSPDGRYIVLPLLDDDGFDVFSLAEKRVLKRVHPPRSAERGFAEGLFIEEKNVFLVSQMTTGMLYEYSYPDFTLMRSISTGGTWSKYIAYSKEKNLLAVSNWLSNDISLIDYDSATVVKKLKTGKAPRGMAFLNKGSILVSLSFEGGTIEKFDVEKGVRLDCISIKNSAMRHIAVSPNEKTAYISDMYHRCVYKLDLASFSITQTVKVFNNPNTVALLNGRYLFVSCRGPNNPVDYTKRSPQNGKIYIINVYDMSVAGIVNGGNQPTGLALSPDGSILCFSDFQDGALELWQIDSEEK